MLLNSWLVLRLFRSLARHFPYILKVRQLTPSSRYAIACIAYLVIIWQLVVNGRASVAAKGNKASTFFTTLAGYTLLVWTAYPVIWGIADGSRILSVDGEIIAYAVLDILAKPIFGAWLLLAHSRIPETVIDLGGFWAHGLSSEGRIRVGDDDEGA